MMVEIDQLPQFDVQKLLEGAVQQLDAAGLSGLHGRIVQAARSEIATVLTAHKRGDKQLKDAEQSLRRMAKTLMSKGNSQVENARLTIMTAADMLRDA